MEFPAGHTIGTIGTWAFEARGSLQYMRPTIHQTRDTGKDKGKGQEKKEFEMREEN